MARESGVGETRGKPSWEASGARRERSVLGKKMGYRKRWVVFVPQANILGMLFLFLALHAAYEVWVEPSPIAISQVNRMFALHYVLLDLRIGL